MITPFATVNAAQLRTESGDRRFALRHLAAALCLAIATLMLAHMALTSALAIPDIAARAISERGM